MSRDFANNSRKDLSVWLILALILAAALALRLYFFVGAGLEDDLGFTGSAYQLSIQGFWVTASDQSLRRMTYLPIALAYWLNDGISLFTSHIYHLLCAAVTIISVFCIGRRYFGTATGVFGAVLLCTVPVHVLYSTRVMPSFPEAAWGALSIWLFMLLEERRAAGNLHYYRLGLGFVGALIGITYLCRETGIVLMAVPGVVLTLRLLGQRLTPQHVVSSGACLGAGLLLLLFIEAATNYPGTMDWFYRWHTVKAAQDVPAQLMPKWNFYLNSLLNVQSLNFLTADNLSFETIQSGYLKAQSPAQRSSLGFLGLLFIVSAGWFLVTCRKQPQQIVLVWFLAYFLFLSLGSSSFSEYVPIRKFTRYETLFLTPACVISGAFLSRLWQSVLGRVLSVVLLVIVSAANLYYCQHGYLKQRAYYPAAQSVRRLVFEHVDPELPVFMDTWEAAMLTYWDGQEPLYKYRDIHWFDKDSTAGAYVVVPRQTKDGKFVDRYGTMPFLADIPEHWIKIAQKPTDRWGSLFQGNSPVLFFVPPVQEQ